MYKMPSITNISLSSASTILDRTNVSLSNVSIVLGTTNTSLYNVSTSLDSRIVIANNNSDSVINLWDYAVSVSTVAHDAYDDVLNLTAAIVNIQDTSNDNTNGLFGKLMNVSTVAHNAYDDIIIVIRWMLTEMFRTI